MLSGGSPVTVQTGVSGPLLRPYAGSLALDVFRGCAALCMIFNHAGFAWLDPGQASVGWAGTMVFIGSLAPVLFFFATGAAIGVSRREPDSGRAWRSVAWKVALLVVADQLTTQRASGHWGLDFFGFIALAMGVVTAVDRLRHPLAVAAGLAVVITALRLVAGPLMPLEVHRSPWGFFFGVFGKSDISYPLAPWMVFPLLGYLLARIGRFPDDIVPPADGQRIRRRRMYLIAVGAGLLCAAAVMAATGKSFFRWSAMNGAYLVLSLGSVLVAGWLCSEAAGRWPAAARTLALRGPAAYLVVPVHYALIHVVAMAVPVPWTPAGYLIGVVVLCAASFMVSRQFGAWLGTATGGGIPWAWLAVLAVAAAPLATGMLVPQSNLAVVAATVGQLSIGALLGARLLARR